MLNRKIFKAYDIRGIYPTEINESAVFQIASSLSALFYKDFESKNGQIPLTLSKKRVRGKKIIIGHDTRLSSRSLYRSLKKGLAACTQKLQFMDAGLITTPTMYFLVNHFQLDGGIMITASHDPKQFNGMKIVGPRARMISGLEIMKLLNS